MITKRSFAELIITEVSGGDLPQRDKWDERDIFLKADMALAQIIATLYREKKNADQYINGGFVKAFENIPLKYNTARKESYFNLPAEMIALDNDKGLRQVSYMKGQDIPFSLIANGSQGVWDKLQVDSGEGSFIMYVEGPKVFIPTMPHNYACKLLVKMICSTSTLDPDELLRVPAEMEAQLFYEVLKMCGINYKTPQKMVNDGNPNTK